MNAYSSNSPVHGIERKFNIRKKHAHIWSHFDSLAALLSLCVSSILGLKRFKQIVPKIFY